MAEERKLVTILFADVTGSTALVEVLDPEDVRTSSVPIRSCSSWATGSSYVGWTR
jgi:hypothetical protein